MTRYAAFLRGVNVGGNGTVSMAVLRETLAALAEIEEVTTYINSGNVLFSSAESSKEKLADIIKDSIRRTFALDIDVAVFTAQEWKTVIEEAPAWWGADPAWKHNLLILIGNTEIAQAVAAIGELKPGIEKVEPGQRVIYQSMSFQQFGKTTTGKLAANPIYKQMTIRNFNTANKLLALLER